MGDEEEAVVRELLKLVPMENKYRGKNYYVRECYSTYYDLVMHLFNKEEKDGVTVTGRQAQCDPDCIGKSVFMAYFFQTYIEQYSDAIVLFAPNDKTSALREVVLAMEGKLIDQERDKSARMEEIMSEHRDFVGEHNIWLLDGPPKKIPDDVRSVLFTSPNELWMKKLSKNMETTATIYMPVRTQGELRCRKQVGPKELLEPIDDRLLERIGAVPADLDTRRPRPAAIDVRFGIFWGVPRVCFETNDGDLVAMVDLLGNAVEESKIHDIRKAMAYEEVPISATQCFTTFLSPSEHSSPNSTSSRREESKSAESEQIARYLPEIKTTDGNATEAKAFRLLQSGDTVSTKSLRDRKSIIAIELPKPTTTVEISNWFEIGPFDRSLPQLVLPASKHFPSIDAVLRSPKHKKTFLFQVAVAASHPVEAVGYAKVLRALGQWEAVQASPATAAALVFVVPKWRMDLMRVQCIISTPPLDDASPVSHVTGIGNAEAASMKTLDIQTIGALRKSTDPKVYRWKLLLQEHEESAVVADSAADGTLKQIPQYVWGV